MVISLVSCADYYAEFKSNLQQSSLHSARYYIEIYDQGDYLVDQLYGKGNLLKESTTLEQGIYYHIYVIMLGNYYTSENMSIIFHFN